MKQREKRLLGVLAGILALWQGGALLGKFILDPVAERQSDLEAREERLAKKQKQWTQSKIAARKLADWNRRSLPPDPVVASSLYQNWLIDLASRMKLSNVVVTPNRTEAKPKGDTYYAISAIIKAQGTLDRLCDFLYEFRRSGLLHRVWRINLVTDEHQGNPVLHIELTVEGLALKDSPASGERDPANRLFAVPDLADHFGVGTAGDKSAYSSLLARNPFVRGYNGPPKPRPSPPREPDEDPREFVYFVGRVSNGSQIDAMLYDRSTNKTTLLTERSEFRMAGVEGNVVSIGADFITLKVKGAIWRMELGDNLAQLKKVAPQSGSGTTLSEPAGAPDRP